MLARRTPRLIAYRLAVLLPLIALTLAILTLAGCSISGGRSTAGDDATGTQLAPGAGKPAVKVALLLPLTGPNSQKIAQSLKQAGELALFDFDNPNIELAPKDTLGTPEGAKKAAQEAVQGGAELIVGPLFANEVSAAAPEAQRAGIPMIAFSSDRKVAGNGVYLLSFLAGSDVGRIVSYAVSQGKTRLAALIPQTEYGRLVEQSFLGVTAKLGVQVVAVKSYPQDANGMIAPVREIAELVKKDAPPQIDALFIPAAADTLPALAPLLPYAEIDTKTVKLLGTSGWDYTGIGKEQALVGAWFPAPDPKGWTDFTKRYVETYGDVPPRLATLAYDAVSLAISLSSNAKGARFTAATLTRQNGFAGVDGLFRLRPDGTSERGFAILEVQRFGNQAVDPAPNGFSSAQY
jgi:ABC-type branched-subunit amino acid transport system substrate-binding protein